MSTERRDRIHDLIVEELREDGSLDDGDIVTYWMTLVATHSADPEHGEIGPVYRVLSNPEPTASQALGLIEWQRMWMQAKLTALVVEDGDDE